MDYLMVFRFIAIAVIILFGVLALYDRFSFSYTSPTRRYKYQRRCSNEEEFETRGSSTFAKPAIKLISNLPRYEGDPERRIWDSKKDRVMYNNKLD